MYNYSNQRILFQCLLLSLWLGVMPIAAGEGGGGGFRPLALKKPLRKTCLPGIFNLLLVGHSNVIIILDLPVLLELN